MPYARKGPAAAEAAPTPHELLSVAAICDHRQKQAQYFREAVAVGYRCSDDGYREWYKQNDGALRVLLLSLWRRLKRHRPAWAARCRTLSVEPGLQAAGRIADELRGVAKRVRPITAAAAEGRYHVCADTLSRRARAGEIADLRPAGHKPNAPLMVDEWEVAALYPAKKI